MSKFWYCSREDVKNALSTKETARNNSQIDKAIAAASEAIEGRLHRRFYPEVDTRYFDHPGENSRILYLEADELLSITSLLAGPTSLDPGDYFLYPSNGDSFNAVHLNWGTNSYFDSGDTFQRSISITGVFRI